MRLKGCCFAGVGDGWEVCAGYIFINWMNYELQQKKKKKTNEQVCCRSRSVYGPIAFTAPELQADGEERDEERVPKQPNTMQWQ